MVQRVAAMALPPILRTVWGVLTGGPGVRPPRSAPVKESDSVGDLCSGAAGRRSGPDAVRAGGGPLAVCDAFAVG